MLWLLLGALVPLIAGALIIKLIPKLTILGILIAIVGAFSAITLGITVSKEDARNAAKCASIDGSYGGDTCFVSGVEKDLEKIGL